MVRSGAGLFNSAWFAGMGWNLAVVIIPSLASLRLTDCLSFVVSTSCSIAIFDIYFMEPFAPVRNFGDRCLHSLASCGIERKSAGSRLKV